MMMFIVKTRRAQRKRKQQKMSDMRNSSVLIFDSGIGGLSVLKELRIILPSVRYIYVADDAAFPYGAWDEEALLSRMTKLFGNLIKQYQPGMIVIGCNTASTLAIEHLRKAYPDEIFVGTVPAVKPAAERTQSGLVSVLATPGTVKRQYTRDLIKQYGGQCHVRLVGSEKLAALAETYMRTGFVDEAAVEQEAAPCFVEKNGKRTDIVSAVITGVGLTEIIEKSDAPKGSFYYHFPGGKEELAKEAVKAASISMAKRMSVAFEEANSFNEGAINLVNRVADWFEDSGWKRGCPITTIALETTPSNAFLAKYVKKAISVWVDGIAEHAKRLGFEGDGVEHAEILLTQIEGAWILARIQQSRRPFDQIIKQYRS
ncbi:Glutamate racemase [Nymphon striatum]|nr:Glutamate racemase [Nymphon striatum]